MSSTDGNERDEMRELIAKYCRGIDSEFQDRWEQWPIDLSNPGPSEATIGLLRRQYILATHMAVSPGIWCVDIAPMILRGMVEVHIWLAWILQSPEDRARMFIEDGLGKEKLVIMHRTDEVKTMGLDPEQDWMLDMSKTWIESQMYSFFIDVNLSPNWSGLDTRKMAEEAGCRDFYRFVYPTYSATVHSTWNHVGKFDVMPCRNPLHAGHRIPVDDLAPITLEFFFLAAKYLDKTFRLVDERLSFNRRVPSTFDMVFPEGIAGTEPEKSDTQDAESQP